MAISERERERERERENLGIGSSEIETYLTWRRRRSLALLKEPVENL
jgi:hypothetical protein